ncbi:hypothetical protein J6590_035315 [Homalodisca vitripennis]|nr:hypothetical protein J6590_035315 [Homalodisca vitripennis]
MRDLAQVCFYGIVKMTYFCLLYPPAYTFGVDVPGSDSTEFSGASETHTQTGFGTILRLFEVTASTDAVVELDRARPNIFFWSPSKLSTVLSATAVEHRKGKELVIQSMGRKTKGNITKRKTQNEVGISDNSRPGENRKNLRKTCTDFFLMPQCHKRNSTRTLFQTSKKVFVGTSQPQWLMNPGPVLAQLEANPDYAHTNYNLRREAVISTRNLAAPPEATLQNKGLLYIPASSHSDLASKNTNQVCISPQTRRSSQELNNNQQEEAPIEPNDTAVLTNKRLNELRSLLELAVEISMGIVFLPFRRLANLVLAKVVWSVDLTPLAATHLLLSEIYVTRSDNQGLRDQDLDTNLEREQYITITLLRAMNENTQLSFSIWPQVTRHRTYVTGVQTNRQKSYLTRTLHRNDLCRSADGEIIQISPVPALPRRGSSARNVAQGPQINVTTMYSTAPQLGAHI